MGAEAPSLVVVAVEDNLDVVEEEVDVTSVEEDEEQVVQDALYLEQC